MKLSSALLFLLCGNIAPEVQAYGSGAGSCRAGVPSVGGSHTRDGATTGDLSTFGGSLIIDGEPLVPGVPMSVTAGPVHDIAIIADTSENEFQGCLIRLETSAGTSAFTLSSAQFTADAFACGDEENALGITHTSAAPKSICSGEVSFLSAALEVAVDVTVVWEQSATSSVYGYDGFVINTVAETSDVTSDPTIITPGTDGTTDPSTGMETPMPTASPVMGASTMAPTASPVEDTTTTAQPTAQRTAAPVGDTSSSSTSKLFVVALSVASGFAVFLM